MPLFGAAAMVVSLTIIIVGLPAQILRNARRKSTDGLAPLLILCALATYTLWALYAWTKPDWFLAASQTPGAIISAVLVGQHFWYRRRNAHAPLEQRHRQVLGTLYAPNAMFVQDILEISAERQTIVGVCRVPAEHSYTHEPVPYVTAEEYTRCISQLSYLLVASLVEHGQTPTSIATLEEFLARMRANALWYRLCKLRYRKQVLKGRPFELLLRLTAIRGLPKVYACEIDVRSEVLFGSVQFAATREPRPSAEAVA